MNPNNEKVLRMEKAFTEFITKFPDNKVIIYFHILF